MLLPCFDYYRPADLSEALALLGQMGDQAKPLAGGTDLLVNLKLKKLAPKALLDLSGLEELKGIRGENGQVSLGALNTASRLAAGATEVPGLLSLGAGALGSPQVRNRATLGGNLVTARPAADICLPLLALGAKAVLAGPDGEREVALDGYFKGPGYTVKEPDEILTRVVLDTPRPGVGGGYQKLGLRQAMEIALVNVAAYLELEDDGKTVALARVALGAVAPTPMLSPGASQALTGKTAEESCFTQAAEAAAADAKPIDDHRGSAAYRRDMVRTLTLRALRQALSLAQGSKEAQA
ncbi:MAG: xanthine dehydrogenase family protein subunit M [Deltaproteobacteria bacterium]|nr:xanthine dehydrogenase family protein subunit M [Deltaproteobacteria bacterium]